jgi:hypothetical protein
MVLDFLKESAYLAKCISTLESGNVVKAAKNYKEFKAYQEKIDATISEKLESARRTLNTQARIVDEMRVELNS